jgi:hypothetical protein
MTEEKVIDWTAIERDYRAGIKSLRAIAFENAVTEGGIRKRAKRDGWERDLAKRIKAKADDLVRKATVRSLVRTENPVSERVLVELNAQVQTEIMLAHRTDIQKSRHLAMKLMRELELQTDNLPLLEQLAEIMAQPDDKGQDKRDALFKKLISLSSRASTLKTMADSLKTLIALERQAFGLDALQEKDNAGVEAVIKQVMDKHGGEDAVETVAQQAAQQAAQMQLGWDESDSDDESNEEA